MQYGEILLIQVQQTAACNALHAVERLAACCRRDRLESTIKLTHEFLSQMLGVRRTTVTVVANVLQQAGLIRYHRGRIEIVDQIGSRRGRANATTPFAARSARSRRSRADSGKHRRPPALKARRPSSLLPISASVGTRIVPCRRLGSTASVRYRTLEAAGGSAGDWCAGVARSRQEAGMAAKPDDKTRIVAHNRKARFNYQIGETLEAGIALTGTEVKSLRQGKATIAGLCRFARRRDLAGQLQYPGISAGRFNHAPKRVRKLLLHRRQINKLIGAVEARA